MVSEICGSMSESYTLRRARMILYSMTEFAIPTMNRKDPLTAAPASMSRLRILVIFQVEIGEEIQTNYSTNVTNAF